MKFLKHKPSLTALLVVLLPVLLGILATLQYRWLGEISTAERERMQQRLQTDVRRFAQDFNAEITKAFFTFQLDAADSENAEKFAERVELWRRQTQFPRLIGEIYVTKKTADGAQKLVRYDIAEKSFSPAEWNENLKPLLAKITEQSEFNLPEIIRAFDSIEPKTPALLVPFFESKEGTVPGSTTFSFKTAATSESNFVIVKFDLNVIKNEVIPEIAKKNFSDSNFTFAVFEKEANSSTVFQSRQNFDFSNADAETGIFDISPDSANFLLLDARQPMQTSLPRMRPKQEGTVVFQSKIEQTQIPPASVNGNKGEVVLKRENLNGNVRILRTNKTEDTIIARTDGTPGKWQLKVSHSDGSLESFVNKTRWRNLGVSFGILGLLGASVVLLFLSTHRAQRAAQRQLDFVSSVTHEFRTPVAVICSAGDNLADGIVSSPAQIEKYGKLIRREGNRLSEMVEQILEFAGARARRKKYDFQPVSVAALIENVLQDCQPLIEEKGFALEKQIAPNLPDVSGDAAALKQSVQNLVNNALKYSGENRWLRVSAEQNKNRLQISVEDKGIGIDSREIRQIFEPFYRGQKAVAEQIHGNGLGLSLVKQIIEAHGGEVRVESRVGEGSRFTIEIPVIIPEFEPQRRGDAEFLKA